MVPQHGHCCPGPMQSEVIRRLEVPIDHLIRLLIMIYTTVLQLLSVLAIHQWLSTHVMEQLIQVEALVFSTPMQYVVIVLHCIVDHLNSGGSSMV